MNFKTLEALEKSIGQKVVIELTYGKFQGVITTIKEKEVEILVQGTNLMIDRSFIKNVTPIPEE